MIIVCPACSDPYRIDDDKIAALVQVACPHCQERIILDFEAANDASLVEPGMRMAQGFRGEAEYRQAAGGETVAAAASAPAPVAAPARPSPTVQPAAAPLRPAPEIVAVPAIASEPAAAAAGVSAPAPAPRAPATTPAPTAATVARPIEVPIELERRVAPASEAIIELSAPVRPVAAAPDADLDVEVEAEVEAEGAGGEEEEPRAKASPHAPPHTPPQARAASAAPSPTEPVVSLDAERPTPAELSQSHPVVGRDEAEPSKKPRGAGRALLMLLIGLVLIGGALAAWAYVETGDPNPIPFVQTLLE